MKIQISLAQTCIQLAQTQINYERAVEWIQKAASAQSQLILFPELWSNGYDLPNCQKYAAENKIILHELCSLAQNNHISIGGSMLLEENGEIYNTFSLISSEGYLASQYRKVHLFSPMAEKMWCKPGNSLETVDFGWGKIGLGICYDLRFPELFRALWLKGVNIFLLPAQWPIQRIQHWKTLIRARAIENLSFFAACNCVGQTGNDHLGGCSAVISPWGETLVEGSDTQPQLLTIQIDMDQVARARRALDLVNDRRPEIYTQ